MLSLVAWDGIGDEIWLQHWQVVGLLTRTVESSSNLSPSLLSSSLAKDEWDLERLEDISGICRS